MKIVGITGHMGAGKSTLAKTLAQHCGFDIIELDDIRRYALWESSELCHILLREQLADKFELRLDNTFLDRGLLTETIFYSYDNLQKYSEIATPYLKKDVKATIVKNSFVVWAWLLEENYTDITNSFTILVHRDIEKIIGMEKRQHLEPTHQDRLKYKEQFEIVEFYNNSELTNDKIKPLMDKIHE